MDLMRSGSGLLLSLVLGACAPSAPPSAQLPPVEISGVLHGEQRLQGRVLMTDDVRIPAGSRLVIAPGTEVLIRPAESTKIDPEYLSPLTELLVGGELVVDGVAGHEVQFLPLAASDRSEVEDVSTWAGIELLPGGRVTLRGVTLSGAEVGLLVSGGEAVLEGVSLAGNRYGVMLQNGGELVATRVAVRGGETGLFCWDRGVLTGERFEILDQDEEGIYLAPGCRGSLRGSRLAGNDIGLVGILAGEADLVFERNRVDRLVGAETER